jgi:hypothetical protein
MCGITVDHIEPLRSAPGERRAGLSQLLGAQGLVEAELQAVVYLRFIDGGRGGAGGFSCHVGGVEPRCNLSVGLGVGLAVEIDPGQYPLRRVVQLGAPAEQLGIVNA